MSGEGELLIFSEREKLLFDTPLFSRFGKFRREYNYLPKCWNKLFSKLRFREIFFSSSEVRASAEIVRDESRFRNCTYNTSGK